MWDLGGIAFDRTRVLAILKKMRDAEAQQKT